MDRTPMIRTTYLSAIALLTLSFSVPLFLGCDKGPANDVPPKMKQPDTTWPQVTVNVNSDRDGSFVLSYEDGSTREVDYKLTTTTDAYQLFNLLLVDQGQAYSFAINQDGTADGSLPPFSVDESLAMMTAVQTTTGARLPPGNESQRPEISCWGCLFVALTIAAIVTICTLFPMVIPWIASYISGNVSLTTLLTWLRNIAVPAALVAAVQGILTNVALDTIRTCLGCIGISV